jgi:UDP-N-acetylglucosamine 2-epimerase (non-hydrolysing)
MIDSLLSQLKRAERSTVREDLGLSGKDYAALTLHRPSNVDDEQTFARIMDALEQISQRLPIIFPVHPRTRKAIAEFGFAERVERATNLRLIEPLGYLDFLRLYSGARLVLTDSGGIQEETTALGIPCLTLRENTERPVTVEMGTNTIVGTDTKKIIRAAFNALDAPVNKNSRRIPPLWDGHTAERILDEMLNYERGTMNRKTDAL